MNGIGNGSQRPPGQGTGNLLHDGGLHAGRQQQGRTHGREGSIDGRRSTASERAASFQRSIRNAAREDADERDTATESEGDRLLATAEWSGGGLPSPSNQSAQPPVPQQQGEPVVHRIELIIADLTSRVEQAIRAELFSVAGGPMSIQLDLSGLVDGLKGLTVTVTATSLDVTLTRTDGGVSEELVRAAQELADRLSQRFAKRVVRVLDSAATDGEPDQPDAGGMNLISKLLGRPASGT
jgi:hypothetical protein